MKKILYWACLSILVVACVSPQKTTQSHNTALFGTYYANLPCQNCSGVMVDLVIEPNNTYAILKQAKGSPREDYETGTWRLENNQLHLSKKTVGNDSSIPPEIKTLAINPKNQLVLLDPYGNPHKKDGARYLFVKK